MEDVEMDPVRCPPSCCLAQDDAEVLDDEDALSSDR